MTAEITAGALAVRILNAGLVLFLADGISKKDLARYFAAAARRMLPWLRAAGQSAP
jgi:DNA primase